MVFTTRLSGGSGGRNALEKQLHRLGAIQINSTPNHPTTCGKVERFHQTLKKHLNSQPRAATLTELHHQLDAFCDEYNPPRPALLSASAESLPTHAVVCPKAIERRHLSRCIPAIQRCLLCIGWIRRSRRCG